MTESEDDLVTIVSPLPPSWVSPFGKVLIAVTFRASSEVERQKWVTALELAKAKAIQVKSMNIRDI